MSFLVSAIVPVFNARAYLERCVRSILGQTYRNLELILIDDGSTDGSSGLCDEFAIFDDRVRVIHQYNSGVSAARNRGILEARGEFISFVDSDDWLEPVAYETCLSLMVRESTDICLFDYSVIKDESKEPTGSTAGYESPVNPISIIKRYFDVTGNAQMASCWAMLISKTLIKANNLAFDENMTICEDFLFMLRALLSTSAVSIEHNSLYNYRRDNVTSITSEGSYLQCLYDSMSHFMVKAASFSLPEEIVHPWWVYTVSRCISNECRAKSNTTSFIGRVNYANKLYFENRKWFEDLNEFRGDMSNPIYVSARLLRMSRLLFVAVCVVRLWIRRPLGICEKLIRREWAIAS